MVPGERKIEIASSTEIGARGREVQLLINLAEPDPEYQPFVVTDEATLFDAVATEEAEMWRRFDAYFGGRLALNLHASIWRVVDAIKRLRPGWPEDPGPS